MLRTSSLPLFRPVSQNIRTTYLSSRRHCSVSTALAQAEAATQSAAAGPAAASPAMDSTPQKKPASNGILTPAKKSPRKPAVAHEVTPALLDKARKIAEQLNQLYPSPPIPLEHSSSFQLLVAVILSAQTTDKKVNEVTPHLFKVAPDAQAMAQMEVADIQKIIQPIGLAPTKAKNLSNMSKLLLERHGGVVPSSFEELEALPGVGHKTASVVMSQAFGHPAFPVDTHIHRLAERWGLSSGKSVEQTEADLKALLPPGSWRDVHLQIIYFGREHCPAKQHDVTACPICSWAGRKGSSSTRDSGSKAAVLNNKKPAAGAKRKAAATSTAVAAAATSTAVAAAATSTAVAEAAVAVVAAEAAAAADITVLSAHGSRRQRLARSTRSRG